MADPAADMTAGSDIRTSRYVVMGVAGCGKSTVGRALADQLEMTFIDGDDLHPVFNIDKMRQGEPLTDADRAPWLERVGDRLEPGTVIACSALKRAYRDTIRRAAGGPVVFVYLRGAHETLAKRMRERTGHFMPLSLLESQLATLEEPSGDELSATADIEGEEDVIVERLIKRIEELNREHH
jgi:gluconokinase